MKVMRANPMFPMGRRNNRWMNDWMENAGQNTGFELPSVNVKEEDDRFMLEIAAPGLAKDLFTISLEKDVLSISAEKKDDNESVSENYKRREFNYTSFKRSFYLPDTVNGDSIKAEYENGILYVQIPKKEEAKMIRRMIEIS